MSRIKSEEDRVRELLSQVALDNDRYSADDDPEVLSELLCLGEKKPTRRADLRRIEELALPAGWSSSKQSRPLTAPGDSSNICFDMTKNNEKSTARKLSAKERKEALDRLSRPKMRPGPDTKGPKYLEGRGAWNRPSGGRFNLSNPKSWIDWNVYLTKHVPGPASYPNASTPGSVPSGGRFNSAKPPSDLELAILRSKGQPGPGEHGATFSSLGKSGVGKVPMARGKTAIDYEIYRAQSIPSPGQYDLPDSGTLIRGGRFGKHMPKSSIDEAIYRAKDLPGPSDYYAEFSYKAPAPHSKK